MQSLLKTSSLEQSGNNIKHLTLNTKHLTVDTNTQFSHDEKRDVLSPAAPSGLLREVTCSGVGITELVNSQFEYIAVSLKTQVKTERLEVNVDFKLQNSTTFNKLVFNLVCWNRRREFFENIKDIKDWKGYQQAYDNQGKEDYIGKGRPRQRQNAKGAIKRSPIKEHTSMLVTTGDQIECHLWIEDAYFTLQFESWSDKRNIFCAKAEYVNNPGGGRIKAGGWV
jgi:hypothetical protein